MKARIYVEGEPDVTEWENIKFVPREGDHLQRGYMPEDLVVKKVFWHGKQDFIDIITDRVN